MLLRNFGKNYNPLYKHFTDNSILYKKQFGFHEGYSTENAIFPLVNQITNSFERKQFTLGVFVDLSIQLIIKF